MRLQNNWNITVKAGLDMKTQPVSNVEDRAMKTISLIFRTMDNKRAILRI